MELIQPIRHSQFVGQAPMAKHAPGKRLLLVDPYPRNNPYRLTASERRAVWFPKLSLPVIAAYTPENWEVNLSMKRFKISTSIILVTWSVSPS